MILKINFKNKINYFNIFISKNIIIFFILSGSLAITTTIYVVNHRRTSGGEYRSNAESEEIVS